MENSKQENEPRVRLFGEEVGKKPESESKGKRRFRHDGGVFWGLVLVFGGVMLFLNNIGLVPWQFWQHVWPFWPLILILAGVNIIFGQNLLSEIVSTLLALAFLALVLSYALIKVDSPLVDYLPAGLVELGASIHPINNYFKQ